MGATSETVRFGLDSWEWGLAKMGLGWTVGMLLGIGLLLMLLP